MLDEFAELFLFGIEVAIEGTAFVLGVAFAGLLIALPIVALTFLVRGVFF